MTSVKNLPESRSSANQQVRDDLEEVLSTVSHVPYTLRHVIYGGLYTLPEPHAAVARNACIEHRFRTAKSNLTREQAAREVDLELRNPDRCSVYGAFKAIENQGGTVNAKIRQRLAALVVDHPHFKPTKAKMADVFDDAAEKARAVSDLCQMSRESPHGIPYRDWLSLRYKESLAGFSWVKDSNIPGCDIAKTLYANNKGLEGFQDALAASSAFAHDSRIYVPFVSPYDLTNRW